jgi:hypothetical protein
MSGHSSDPSKGHSDPTLTTVRWITTNGSFQILTVLSGTVPPEATIISVGCTKGEEEDEGLTQ